MNGKRRIFAALLALTLSFACTLQVFALDVTTPRPIFNEDSYRLDKLVLLSRHNIRSPLTASGSVLSEVTNSTWHDWTSTDGELSVRGGQLETAFGQYYRKYCDSKGLFKENVIPAEGETRFYANSLQRTVATANFFVAGMFPTSNIEVEHKYEIGKGDATFLPILRYTSESYEKQLLSEMTQLKHPWFDETYTQLEKVLDFPNSRYAKKNGVRDIDALKDEYVFTAGNEIKEKGALVLGCQAADALVLQYYEEPDDSKAGFGKKLSMDEWREIGGVTDEFLSELYTTPTGAPNFAHGILVEMKNEMETPDRKLTFLCGHDSTLAPVLASLRAEEYLLPGAITTVAPIGSKIEISKWRGSDGGEYATLALVYQSAEQLRNTSELGLNNPPCRYQISLKGLEPNADGFYSWKDLCDRFSEAIVRYDGIKALYGCE